MAQNHLHDFTKSLKFCPPNVEDSDDLTGAALIQRDDGQEATARKRLAVYQSQTRPLVDCYLAWAATGDAQAPRHVRISGIGDVGDIAARALAALDG